MLKIEIFEIKNNNVFSELDTEVEAHIVNLYNKYKDQIQLNKVNIIDKEAMKKHKDILKHIEQFGVDILPLIKVDGKILEQSEFIPFIQKKIQGD